MRLRRGLSKLVWAILTRSSKVWMEWLKDSVVQRSYKYGSFSCFWSEFNLANYFQFAMDGILSNQSSLEPSKSAMAKPSWKWFNCSMACTVKNSNFTRKNFYTGKLLFHRNVKWLNPNRRAFYVEWIKLRIMQRKKMKENQQNILASQHKNCFFFLFDSLIKIWQLQPFCFFHIHIPVCSLFVMFHVLFRRELSTA